MIEWLEVQGYPILENTSVDCKHYLTCDKRYKILNIYDDELPQIQAFQDSTLLGISLTRVYAEMYHSKNQPFMSMFPSIKDSDFFSVIRKINNGSINFSTESIAWDRLHTWIRRD